MFRITGRVWKKIFIKGVEMHYSVDGMGNVRNDNTQYILGHGYCRDYRIVGLYNKDMIPKSHSVLIHQLVARAFVSNDDPLTKIEIDHINGNKEDNVMTNLEWVTRSEQMKRAFRLGLCVAPKGVDNPSHIYSEELVRSICVCLENHTKTGDVIRLLKLNKSHRYLIKKIRAGRSWKHVSKEYNILKINKKQYDTQFIQNICKLLSDGKTYAEIFNELGIVLKRDRDDIRALCYSIKRRGRHVGVAHDYDIK